MTPGFEDLYGARFIVTHTIGGRHYALVACRVGSKVLILEITNPAAPSLVATVADGDDGVLELYGPNYIAIHTMGSRHYALAASDGDYGMQVIDITNPEAPFGVVHVTDGGTFDSQPRSVFPALGNTTGVVTHTIENRHYAVSVGNGAAQIMELMTGFTPLPRVSSVAVSSTPTGGYYDSGDTITFRVTFNVTAIPTGAAYLPFELGGETREAEYASGSGTTALVFSYTVTDDDGDDLDGISWPANGLVPKHVTRPDGEGGISSLASPNRFVFGSQNIAVADFRLQHSLQAPLSAHKVDTSTPTPDISHGQRHDHEACVQRGPEHDSTRAQPVQREEDAERGI